MVNRAHAGQSTTEYGLIIASIAIVAIICLSNLGPNLSQLFKQNSDSLLASQASALEDMPSQANNTKPSATSIAEYDQGGTGYYTLVPDPETGKFKLMTMTESTTPVNVTSLDGSQRNTLGSLRIANTLFQRAEEATNLELKNYYQKMAEKAYYLGAVEGYMDKVVGFSDNAEYTNGNALKDIGTFKREIRDLMKNPPASMDNQTYASVMPLAVEVYNIGQEYEKTLHSYIKPDGSTLNFIPDTRLGAEPGSILKLKPEQVPDIITPGNITRSVVSVDDLISFDELKKISTQVLTDNHVDSAPVEVTWTNAKNIEKQNETHNKNQKRK